MARACHSARRSSGSDDSGTCTRSLHSARVVLSRLAATPEVVAVSMTIERDPGEFGSGRSRWWSAAGRWRTDVDVGYSARGQFHATRDPGGNGADETGCA